MLLAPELIMPELEAPTYGTYEELLEGHDWETHLPPSPEGRLIRTADYCPDSGASVHFLLGPEGVAILAARFTVPAAAPGQQPPTRLFLLEHDRMERKNPEACRQALRKLNPDPGPAWSVPVSQDGQPRWEEKHQPLEPHLAPAFPDILRQHQWKQHQKHQAKGAREAEYIHECALCRARMHTHLDRRGRIARVRVRLPAARECHYHGGGSAVTPVTGAEFYGQELLRLTREQLDTREKGKASQRSRRRSACPRPTGRREHEERPESRDGIHNPETRNPGHPRPHRRRPPQPERRGGHHHRLRPGHAMRRGRRRFEAPEGTLEHRDRDVRSGQPPQRRAAGRIRPRLPPDDQRTARPAGQPRQPAIPRLPGNPNEDHRSRRGPLPRPDTRVLGQYSQVHRMPEARGEYGRRPEELLQRDIRGIHPVPAPGMRKAGAHAVGMAPALRRSKTQKEHENV